MAPFVTAAEYVLDLVKTHLAASQTVFTPGRAFVAPGAEVAWDDCCNGQLWVRIFEIQTKQTIQSKSAVDPRCGISGTLLRLAVGHLHCVSTLADSGAPPRAATLSREAGEILDTAYAIRTALVCHEGLGDRYRPLLGNWRALGPSGGCAGGEWALDLDVNV